MRWKLRGPVWDPLPQLQFDHVFRNLIAIIRPCAWAASPERGWHQASLAGMSAAALLPRLAVGIGRVRPEGLARMLPRLSAVGIMLRETSCMLRRHCHA